MARTNTIAILFTGDIHGHIRSWRGWPGSFDGKMIGGVDHLATAIEKARQEFGKENTLLVDAGDACGDTLIAAETRGLAIVEVMNALGYEAMTFGNHEFDYGLDDLRTIISTARFPFVACNLTPIDKNIEPLAPAFIMREVGGIKIGIIGVAYPNTPLTTAEKNVTGVHFDDPAATVGENVTKLRASGAKIVVVLSHYGLGADTKLAMRVQGIDLIIGGHSHNRTEEPIRVGQTSIVHAGAHCSDLGILEINIPHGRIDSVRNRLVLLDNGIVPSTPKIASLIDSIEKSHRNALHEKISAGESPLERAQTIAGNQPRKRDQESPVDSLFADVIRAYTKADVAVLPGVGYGVALPQGDITAEGLRNLLPHSSKLFVVKLTGRQIRSILEQSIENTFTDDPKQKVGGMVQVSGLRFEYDANCNFGERVSSLDIDGVPVNEASNYSIATNSLLIGGGHNYRDFLQALEKREVGEFYEIVKNELKRIDLIKRPGMGRISRIESGVREKTTSLHP